jgi:hypothetical protein
LEDGDQVGEVEADSKGEEKSRKTDTENARKKSIDWSVEKMWWRLGEEAWNQAERKKSVDWTVKSLSWRLVEEARQEKDSRRTGPEALGAEHPLLETGERHREHPLLEAGVGDGRCGGGKGGVWGVGAGAEAEVESEPGVGERGSTAVLVVLVVVDGVVAWG